MTDLKKIEKGIRAGKKILETPLLLGAVLGTGVFALDQLFKSSVEKQPEGVLPHDVSETGIGAEIELQRLHNAGIAMGMLKETPEAAGAAAGIGTAAALVSLATRDQEDGIGTVSDFLLLGGAASNLYDRKKRGYVVDYIHIKKGPLSKLVFNLGDGAIAAGALAGSLSRLFHRG